MAKSDEVVLYLLQSYLSSSVGGTRPTLSHHLRHNEKSGQTVFSKRCLEGVPIQYCPCLHGHEHLVYAPYPSVLLTLVRSLCSGIYDVMEVPRWVSASYRVQIGKLANIIVVNAKFMLKC
jgi:hypothetical protein